ncbi:homoserine O-succinyltransferase [Leuconostoc falkenbergense]|uniref:Homoserine O-acetyltransferase n=1 Tax=Leuconostoc falkenbergense TaxID=2766470 RepID=A0A9X3IQQ0_9LACO|nr:MULTISPECIES: homoserine O-succinyltransferase [Leuconostoc]HCU42608.1 homoserine O-succinyltransferase [Leuconostoc pseudomesenteroides]MCT4389029.1 homoserine O-succinyltransferase [Leuconostoc falkenbergense]MCT4410033.1 homoserine O-succinyltransferase [Leuconostoc falkenbergense]MCX7579757.1 homoserine O-succinyltransferase [Leuconostoc falkenbergense]MDM7647384.1 homoserine O-succinyltransferase [Leuconostoc falkenbergense]
MSVILENGLLKQQQTMIGSYKLLQPTITILLVNLMPNRLQTEKQFVRLLNLLSINVRVTFAVPATHNLRHSAIEVADNYLTLEDIWHQQYDGLIVTGAPVDQIKFEQIDYWEEFQHLLQWRKTSVTESLFACWATYAAGYAERNFPVKAIKNKVSGVYRPRHVTRSKLSFGLEVLKMPQSRYFTVPALGVPRRLKVADDDELGAFILRDEGVNSTYITGHLEYDTTTLADEYERDLVIDNTTLAPENYFVDGYPVNSWQQTANQFFKNWGQLIVANTHKITAINLISALN